MLCGKSCVLVERAASNSCMNPAALTAVRSLLPGAVARRTRINCTAPGCLATQCILTLLSGLRVMHTPFGRQHAQRSH